MLDINEFKHRIKMVCNNNYRRLHGKHARRWRNELRAAYRSNEKYPSILDGCIIKEN